MIHTRNFAESAKEVIDKGAFLGMDKVKSFLLKGVVFYLGENYKAFGSDKQ